MPGHKRKYNVRFPPKRIKKIMQKDAERWHPEPQRSARALEMFLKSLLTKTCLITQSKFTTVVSVAHMKQCIESEKLFDFLKELVEQETSETQRDNRGLSMWPLYRTKQSDPSVKKKPDVVDTVTRRSLDSVAHDSSSSESELYIGL